MRQGANVELDRLARTDYPDENESVKLGDPNFMAIGHEKTDNDLS
jgi:hypothetical protein